MTTDATVSNATPLRPDVAGRFLNALTSQDFVGLARSLADEVTLDALVPRGLRHWTGTADVAGAFATWFDDTDTFSVLEASIGTVAGLVGMRWRFRLSAGRLGSGPYVVEQNAYVATNERGQIIAIRLVCSGYRPETGPGVYGR
jgi:hypothetical protein